MSVLFFSIFSLLFISGSRIFTCAQNCAIPSSIFIPEDDVRVETALVNTILGRVETFNVEDIRSDTAIWEDYIGFTIDDASAMGSIEQQYITLSLKSPLKNELDDKMRKTIESVVELTCADGKQKRVTFSVGIKDENTKCPFFTKSDYTYTIVIDNSTGPIDYTLEPITVTDGDRDFVNANIFVEVVGDFQKQFDINVIAMVNELTKKSIADEHTFEIRLTLAENSTLINSGSINLKLKVENIVPQKDPSLDCVLMNPKSFANVLVKFVSNSTETTQEPPEEDTTFEPFPLPDPHHHFPPEFSNFYYYTVISNLSEAYKGNIVHNIYPSGIIATDPDELHGVKYNILPGEFKGILDIDPNDGTIFFKDSLRIEYIQQLRDHMEVYKIQAYISESWVKPSMQFAYVPLIVIYDIYDYENGTVCPPVCSTTGTTPHPWTTPIITLPTNGTTRTTKDPEVSDPSDAPVLPTDETFLPTDESVRPTNATILPTDEPALTTEESPFPTEETPFPTEEKPFPTEEKPFPTEEKPLPTEETPFPTDEPTIPTDEPTIPTDEPGFTTDEPIFTTDTVPLPSTTVEIPTENPTTEAESTTSLSTTTTMSSSVPTNNPNSTSPTVSSTGTLPWTTGSDFNTTTTPPPITCPRCNVPNTNFACTREGVFVDPYLCNIFHQCVRNYTGIAENTIIYRLHHYVNRCPPYTGFDLETKTCVFPPRCDCLASPEETDILDYGSPSECPPCDCRRCRQVQLGESVCDGTSELYPDPHTCDIFHSCRDDDAGGFIDCSIPCPTGTGFCPKRKVCVWKYELPEYCNW